MLDVIKKILSLGTIDENRSGKITNKVILNELVEHFKERMEDLSVGKRLLYPMSFNILMHPDDYNISKESFPFILPEVVSEFYSAIKRRNKKLNAAPPASYWFFQFSACQIADKDGEENIIKKGEIITTGSLVTFDINKALSSGTHKETNTRLSFKCQNSQTNATNINMDALRGMEILSEGVFTYKFDMDLNEDTRTIESASGTKRIALATLRWPAADGNTEVYDMVQDKIEISGKKDNRSLGNIVKINNDSIITSHVQIKYDSSTKAFFLAAFAKTRLNEHEVPLSVAGGTPQWVPLPKRNSKIFMNDVVNLMFNAN